MRYETVRLTHWILCCWGCWIPWSQCWSQWWRYCFKRSDQRPSRSDKYISIKDTAPDGTAQAMSNPDIGSVHCSIRAEQNPFVQVELCVVVVLVLVLLVVVCCGIAGSRGGHAQQQCSEQASYESRGVPFTGRLSWGRSAHIDAYEELLLITHDAYFSLSLYK